MRNHYLSMCFLSLKCTVKKPCVPLVIVIMLLSNGVLSQSFFTSKTSASLPAASVAANNITAKGTYHLDEQAMRNYLLQARMEFRNNGLTIPLTIPLPDGTSETFNMVESPILSAAIAAQNPGIKTYAGFGTTQRRSVIRITLTPEGFDAIILNPGGNTVYFEPYAKGVKGLYFNYFLKNVNVPQQGMARSGRAACGESFLNKNNQSVLTGTDGSLSTGSTLTTYRLAFAATAEFTGEHGGTQASGLATIVGYVNRMTALYRNELAVSFTLVSGTNLIYTNAATDPYTGDNEVTMLGENQTNVDAIIGTANYDIAHVLSWNADYGSGGGVAVSSSLGDNSYKAQGASIEGTPPYAQVFFDQLVFHEVGHQFGMSHSYNSNIPVCTTRRQSSAAEPGSGATIMSYGFTCGTDDYTSSTTTGPILAFHTVNYDQAVAYMASIPGVGTSSASGNAAPVVSVPGSFTIPKSTPFALTGSATDPDSDPMTYSWEGTNIGLVAVPDATVLADPSKPPFFRTYEPAANGATRIFPKLSAILNGSNYAIGDKLPSVSTTTTHRLSVRDNYSVAGGLSYGSVTVTVDGAIGPFLETTNLAGSYLINSDHTITWSVNGTHTATPNVKISLSIDGGITWPSVLVASTPNDGSQTVILPNTPTTTARIKVEAIGNIFFDISNVDFTITSTVLPVQLIGFNASLQGKKDAIVQWKTATELNTKGYEIESRTGNGTFTPIAFVPAKGANGLGSIYSRQVPNLDPGTWYFRLKMIDMDGKFSYSEIRVLEIANAKGIVSIYPNPVRNNVTVILSAEMANASLRLVNNTGQTLIQDNTTRGTIRLLYLSSLPAGIYLLQIMDGNKLITTQKIIKVTSQ